MTTTPRPLRPDFVLRLRTSLSARDKGKKRSEGGPAVVDHGCAIASCTLEGIGRGHGAYTATAEETDRVEPTARRRRYQVLDCFHGPPRHLPQRCRGSRDMASLGTGTRRPGAVEFRCMAPQGRCRRQRPNAPTIFDSKSGCPMSKPLSKWRSLRPGCRGNARASATSMSPVSLSASRCHCSVIAHRSCVRQPVRVW